MRVFGYCVIALLFAGPVHATSGEADFTVWRKHVPAGWKTIRTAQGKLSAASQGDAVLIIEKQDASLRQNNDGLGAQSLNLNPRALVFLTKIRGGYRQTAPASEGFIPSEGSQESPCLSDPFEDGDVQISKGVISITLKYWLSCGSYEVSTKTFKFRLENRRHRLIGIEQMSFSRTGYGGGTTVSANYLTGKKETTTGISGIGPDVEDAKLMITKTRWSRLKPGKFYLENMQQTECDAYDVAPSWCYL
jgi:hypothetical protein